MSEPFSIALSRVDWSVFSTLTFRREVSVARAMDRAKSWLKWCAHVNGQRFEDFKFVVRVELGELGKRVHLHTLIAVNRTCLKLWLMSGGKVPVAHRKWALGLSKHRLVASSADPVVSYMLKDLDVGGDAYELAKTARTPHLMLSCACLNEICSGHWHSTALRLHRERQTNRQHDHRDEHTGARTRSSGNSLLTMS
jgi:hypothetical protein